MKAIKTILAFVVIMTISLGIKAQDKYEYSTVIYFAHGNMTKGIIAISYQGKYTETAVKIDEGSIMDNLTPLLEAINKMNLDGWEVYTNSVMPGESGANPHVYYFLRKKKS